jgi:hypothetical protein
MFRWMFVSAAALWASACASVPIGTMVQLATWNPAETDPAEIRAAVRLPDGLGLASGSPVLALSSWRDEEERIEDRMVLVEVVDPVETAPLARWGKPGFTIHAYRIPSDDVARITEFRDRARAEALNHFSIQIEAKGCRHGDFAGPVRIATFLKTDASADYVMLTRETDVTALAKAAQASTTDSGLPPCNPSSAPAMN